MGIRNMLEIHVNGYKIKIQDYNFQGEIHFVTTP